MNNEGDFSVQKIIIDIFSTGFFYYFHQFLNNKIQSIGSKNHCSIKWLTDTRQLEVRGQQSLLKETLELITQLFQSHGYLEIELTNSKDDIGWEKTENLIAVIYEKELNIHVKYFGEKTDILQSLSNLGNDSKTEFISCFLFKKSDYEIKSLNSVVENDLKVEEVTLNDLEIDELNNKKFKYFTIRNNCFKFNEKLVFSYVFTFFKPILNNFSHHIFFYLRFNEIRLVSENSSIMEGLIYILEQTLRDSLKDVVVENLYIKSKIDQENELKKLVETGRRRNDFILEYKNQSQVTFVGRKQVLKTFLEDNYRIFNTSEFKSNNIPLRTPHSHTYSPMTFSISSDISCVSADVVAMSLPVKRFILDTGASLAVRKSLSEEDVLKIQKNLLKNKYKSGEYFYENLVSSKWKGFACIIVSKTNLYNYLKLSTSALLQEVDSFRHQSLVMTIFGGSYGRIIQHF